jgi:chromosome segregation ATPase
VSNIGDKELIEKIEKKIQRFDRRIQKYIATLDDLAEDRENVDKKFQEIKAQRKLAFDKTFFGVSKHISAVYRDLTSDDIQDEFSGGQAFLYKEN